jgi:hypothetical protein
MLSRSCSYASCLFSFLLLILSLVVPPNPIIPPTFPNAYHHLLAQEQVEEPSQSPTATSSTSDLIPALWPLWFPFHLNNPFLFDSSFRALAALLVPSTTADQPRALGHVSRLINPCRALCLGHRCARYSHIFVTFSDRILVLLVRGDDAIVCSSSASWLFHRPPFFTRGFACLASCFPRADIRRLLHHLDPFVYLSPLPMFTPHSSRLQRFNLD